MKALALAPKIYLEPKSSSSSSKKNLGLTISEHHAEGVAVQAGDTTNIWPQFQEHRDNVDHVAKMGIGAADVSLDSTLD